MDDITVANALRPRDCKEEEEEEEDGDREPTFSEHDRFLGECQEFTRRGGCFVASGPVPAFISSATVGKIWAEVQPDNLNFKSLRPHILLKSQNYILL